MAHNNIEIEIQVSVENSGSLLDFLQAQAAFVGELSQADEYFSSPTDDFLAKRPVSRWLRLRRSAKGCFLNYKNWHFNELGESHHCDEFETKIEDIDSAKKILLALNFRPIVMVEKVRKIWHYQDYEIALDSVLDLGDFVEIEYIGRDKNVIPEEITKAMILFLKNLGVGKITRNHVGYPFLALFPEEVEYQIL